jgi:hypothetical protein
VSEQTAAIIVMEADGPVRLVGNVNGQVWADKGPRESQQPATVEQADAFFRILFAQHNRNRDIIDNVRRIATENMRTADKEHFETWMRILELVCFKTSKESSPAT